MALPAAARAAGPARPYDFDGDGRAEAVAAIPGWRVRGAPNAGAVAVLRVAAGRAPLRARPITEDAPGVPGRAEGDDGWGASISSADFDGDGFADLAVSAPGDGAIWVLRGAPGGLAAGRVDVLAGTGTLAGADLNADGDADLAVGDPNDQSDTETFEGSGSVHFIPGSPTGLVAGGARTLARPRPDDDRFGTVLAVGDVDGDGRPDLVEGSVGRPVEVDEEWIFG